MELGVRGVEEHAFGLKSLAEATTLRNHVLRCFELASADPAHLDDGAVTTGRAAAVSELDLQLRDLRPRRSPDPRPAGVTPQ